MKSAVLALLAFAGLFAVASACQKNTLEYITDENFIIAPFLGPLVNNSGKTNWTGTAFVPSNASLSGVLTFILEQAGLASLPPALTLADVFAVPAMVEILKYHVVNKTVFDASVANSTVGKLKVGAKAVLGPYKTELAAVKNQAFCMMDARGVVSLELVRLANGTNITVVAAGGVEVPVFAPVHTCGGMIYIINGVLFPCALEESSIGDLVSLIKSFVPSPAPPTVTRGTPNTTNTTNTTSGGTTRDVDPTKDSAAASAAGQLLVGVAAAAVMLLVGAVV